MRRSKPIFVISLDFELYWGMRDEKSLEEYRENLLGVRSAIPALLKLFDEYGIHATWATVGFLFFESRDELMQGLPANKPDYTNALLSPYKHLETIGNDESEDPFHYAPSLVKLISSYPHQEIATHTFSHYFCLEDGQDSGAFKDDIEAAKAVAKKYGLRLESLVFPRNQFNGEYLSVCQEMGIKAYRGNQSFWIYKGKEQVAESRLVRGLRLLDSYLNISGHNCYPGDLIKQERPFNIPASRFLRPYSKILRALEPLRLRRILSDMTHAAKDGLVYHLWWHPHNFGVDLDENISFLKKIL